MDQSEARQWSQFVLEWCRLFGSDWSLMRILQADRLPPSSTKQRKRKETRMTDASRGWGSPFPGSHSKQQSEEPGKLVPASRRKNWCQTCARVSNHRTAGGQRSHPAKQPSGSHWHAKVIWDASLRLGRAGAGRLAALSHVLPTCLLNRQRRIGRETGKLEAMSAPLHSGLAAEWWCVER
jgi:hypothetical protein